MPAIGCKSCGKRKSRNLKEEVVIFEPQPNYVINSATSSPSPSGNPLDWKSMSKVI